MTNEIKSVDAVVGWFTSTGYLTEASFVHGVKNRFDFW